MIIVHRGAGALAPGFGLLFALMANVLTYRVFGGSYYEEHRWPKLAVLLVSGLACLIAGVWFKRYRERTAQRREQHIASLSQKHKIVNELAYDGPPDHLMYIPLQYWCIPYFVGALVYVVATF
ncbi:MAG TPA: hypothetical protein VFD75_01425 [Pyrinomonadaceae bacterium]|jgi:hypothetical protein|nr:hypothetical protein [Pyrinomonadaceae bacterium]